MMDLALGVVVGSSTQIALFVVPFSVIVGWITKTDMTLSFHAFETTVFLLSVFIASGILSAVTIAYKGLMDLALGVAVGSSTQIALFVVPFSVIVLLVFALKVRDFVFFEGGLAVATA